MSFLDVEIKILDDRIESTVYRKQSNTGLVMNYYAVCPKAWKSGLITCFLHRAKLICSNIHLFNSEVNKLRNIFSQNAYPKQFFDTVFKKFNFGYGIKQQKTDKNFDLRLGIPYFGKPSHKFSCSLTKLIHKRFAIDLAVYYTTMKTASYFKLKCNTPKSLVSNVVYKFSCLRDANLSYIGMTSRHLVTRVNEHLHSTINKTAVTQHINSCQFCKKGKLDLSRFEILKRCNTDYETKIQEALLIKKNQPKLNTQLYANGCSFLLNIF